MKIKNIVIVGGGTAGWITAHQFLNKTSHRVKVTVIAAKEIPIIGVGESTTGRFHNFINSSSNILPLDEHSFLRETESTFKIGIKHSDWHTVGKSFYSPIGDNYSNARNYPHGNYDDFRIYHVANNLDYDQTFQSQLMIHSKLPTEHNFNVAYHLDTYKVGQYLKDKALTLKSRCTYIEDQVTDIVRNDKGFITSLVTASGKKIKGDLFIDCSGKKRILMKHLTKFKSYNQELLVNRAIPFYIKNKPGELIKNYTHAWAQKYGWMWQIPTQARMGCGYVYSDNHTTPEKAQEEIEKVLGHSIKPLADLKFEAGRLEEAWVHNVFAVGLSSGFIEPLEATSIHASLVHITHFIEHYYKEDMPFECDLLQNQYNHNIRLMWDQIKDFIVFHYISPRKDTFFWRDAASPKRWSAELKNQLEIWKYRMPRQEDYQSPGLGTTYFYGLGNVLWYQIAIGMKLLNSKIARQELMNYGLYKQIENHYTALKKNVKNIMPTQITTNAYYERIRNEY